MATPVPARPAATVILVRDIPGSIEVLMVRRPARGFFGGLTVFPGGAVDPVDRSPLAGDVVAGESSDHEYRSAALRELAEETGLALTTEGMTASPAALGVALFQAFSDAGARLDGEALTLVSRWVTPEEAPSRFDARFYLTQVGATPEVRIDPNEIVDHEWVTPVDALDRLDRDEWQMYLPTIAHLRWLRIRANAADAVAAADGADGRSMIAPRRMEDGSIVPIHLPGET